MDFQNVFDRLVCPSRQKNVFLMSFLGFGLSGFGSALATIFLFKPQSVSVSIIFLTVISYVAGNALEYIIPKTGQVGRWLNPHPFNSKEHLAIVIMSGSASGAAAATEVLATQKLYVSVPVPLLCRQSKWRQAVFSAPSSHALDNC